MAGVCACSFWTAALGVDDGVPGAHSAINLSFYCFRYMRVSALVRAMSDRRSPDVRPVTDNDILALVEQVQLCTAQGIHTGCRTGYAAVRLAVEFGVDGPQRLRSTNTLYTYAL
jgi:hypothetical protein